MKKIYCLNSNSGFTLVELLVVISLLSILAAASLSLINPVMQRRRAEDGVKKSNLEKLSLGIEAYANANGRYPTEAEMGDTDSNKIPDNAEAALYVGKIPNGEPTPGLIYYYSTEQAASPSYFGLSVVSSEDSSKCFKYHTEFGKISECTLTVGCSDVAVIRTNSCN